MPVKLNILLINCLFYFSFVYGQPDTYFNKVYDYREMTGYSNILADLAASVLYSNDNGYYVVCKSWDAFEEKIYPWIMRTKPNGETKWIKEFGIQDTSYRYKYYGGDIHWDTDSNLIILIITYNATLLDSLQSRLVKMDTSGNILWQKPFRYGSGWTEGISLIITQDSGYAVTGRYSPSSSGQRQVYLGKFDSVGNKQWEKLYGGGGDDVGYSLVQTGDGGYMIVGYTESYGGERDLYLIKTDSAGNLIWQKTFGGTGSDGGTGIFAARDGSYILSGWKNVETDNPLAYKGWLINIDGDGNKLWERIYGFENMAGGGF